MATTAEGSVTERWILRRPPPRHRSTSSKASSGNISFDAASNPVSVNVGFFTVTSGAKLTGTGMDGSCDGKICGGATDWLQTTAPVVPGETISLQLALWDTGDHKWDSFVLVDGFTWSVEVAKAGAPNTSAGSAVVNSTLFAKNRPRNLPFVRVTSTLKPSIDKLSAPTLSAWDLQVSCLQNE